MVQVSAHTAADFSVDHHPEVKATGRLWKGLNPPSWRPALAVNYSCRRHHGCVSPVPVRKEERYELLFTARVSVSYYHPDDDEHSRQSDVQERSRAGGHLSLSHALITPT